MVFAIALYDYEAQDDGELTIHAGEHLIILAAVHDGWSTVRNELGKNGFVPAHVIIKTDELDLEPLPLIDEDSPLLEKDANKKALELKDNFWDVKNYGFALEEGDDAATHDKLFENHQPKYEKKVSKQRKRWEKAWKNNFKDVNMKRLCRKGIPPDMRGAIWFRISGAQQKKEDNANLYSSLKDKYRDVVDETTKQITKDITRTFPGNAYFTSRIGKNALKDVLKIFALYNPAVGYCQSMNFIAGMLLFHMDEESTFFMLDTLFSNEKYLPGDLFDPTLKGLHRNTYILDVLLRERYPLIRDHLKTSNVELVFLTTKWFMKLFIGTFPIETTLRIWDAFFGEGFKMLFRIGLMHLHMNTQAILQVHDFDEVITAIIQTARVTYDCRALIKKAFAIPHFGRKRILELREEYDQKDGKKEKEPKKPIRQVQTEQPKKRKETSWRKPRKTRAADLFTETPVAGGTTPATTTSATPHRVESVQLNDLDLEPTQEYIPKIKRKELLGRYDTVVFREAERYLFDRNRTMRRQKQMVEVTGTDLRLEQSYMEYIADACTRVIDGTEGSSDEEDEQEKSKVTDFKKKFPRRPDANTIPKDDILLYQSTGTLLVFNGDREQFAESVKILERREKFAEAGKALITVADYMVEKNEFTNAMLLYERACKMYDRANLDGQVLMIRTDLLHVPTMQLELFETLAENYESIMDKVDQKFIYEGFSALLRLAAFLKGDGSEGTYELKEKLDTSDMKDSFVDMFDRLTEIMNTIENGDREQAEKQLQELQTLEIGEDEVQNKFVSICTACTKYINT